MRFLDIYQVTQALNTVLTNQKQLNEMRRSWQKVDFESVRNQSALVCNCRHEELVQLLEVDFVTMMDSLSKTAEPVREVMAWADKCCERLMGQRVGAGDDRGTLSSRSVLIRWGYVTSQVMRDLVRVTMIVRFSVHQYLPDYSQRPSLWSLPDHETVLGVGRANLVAWSTVNVDIPLVIGLLSTFCVVLHFPQTPSPHPSNQLCSNSSFHYLPWPVRKALTPWKVVLLST